MALTPPDSAVAKHNGKIVPPRNHSLLVGWSVRLYVCHHPPDIRLLGASSATLIALNKAPCLGMTNYAACQLQGVTALSSTSALLFVARHSDLQPTAGPPRTIQQWCNRLAALSFHPKRPIGSGGRATKIHLPAGQGIFAEALICFLLAVWEAQLSTLR